MLRQLSNDQLFGPVHIVLHWKAGLGAVFQAVSQSYTLVASVVLAIGHQNRRSEQPVQQDNRQLDNRGWTSTKHPQDNNVTQE